VLRIAAVIFVFLLCTFGSQQVFRTTVDLVSVFATVTERDGTFATGLKKEDFTVLDNGKPQPITSFAEATQTLSVSLILDTSGSMGAALPRVMDAAAAFLDNLRPDDRATVGSLLYVGPAFTSDKQRLRTSMELLPRDPGSPVWLALDRAITALGPETNRRVIVIYTDGRNSNLGQRYPPKITESSVVSRVETEDVMVYAIGFEGASMAGGIKTLARRSGGRATELRRADNLAAALTGVADELHHQYLLGFTPTVFDGKPHRLEVRVNRSGLSVRARELYIATK
jgi:VWFA-related protein